MTFEVPLKKVLYQLNGEYNLRFNSYIMKQARKRSYTQSLLY